MLATPVAWAGGIQAQSECFGAQIMVRCTSSTSSSARSVSAFTTRVACGDDTVRFVAGEPGPDSCFVISLISDKAIEVVHVDETAAVGVGARLPDPSTGRTVAPASVGLSKVKPVLNARNNQNG
jgi:hypothetical protein